MEMTTEHHQSPNKPNDLQDRLRRKISQALNDYDMLQDNDKVMVACSGGKDSSLLLYLLNEIKRNRDIIIAIMHHEHKEAQMKQEALKQIDHHLTQHLVMPPTTPHVFKQNFADYYGKLPPPTTGRWETKNRNLIIKTTQNEPVHAVASGKVIFARWIPFYGLLTIIQHDHGYLSLYGHNQAQYKKPGDLVQAGDMIATTGQTGGLQHNALFFALRHQKKRLNAKAWLKH